MLFRAGSILAGRWQKWRRSDPEPPVPPPAAAGVHARRTHGPCVPNLMPCIRGAPARANRAPPCPHTDLLAAHPVQPADPCLAWVSLCVQRRSCCAEHGRSPGLQPLWCAWDEFSGPEGRQAAAGRRLGMVWCFSMLGVWSSDCTRSRGYDVRSLGCTSHVHDVNNHCSPYFYQIQPSRSKSTRLRKNIQHAHASSRHYIGPRGGSP